jgi:hypothetical protein
MKNIITKIVLSFLLVFNSSYYIYAESNVETKNPIEKMSAHLRFKRGDVLFKTPETRYETIEVGQDLFENDVLKTEPGAFAVIELPDSSKIKVGPSTKIKIAKLVAQIENQSFEKSSIILRTGKILIDVINKALEPVLEVKTRNAAIAVRGTRFFVSQTNEDEGNLWVAADHGELEITSLRVRGMEDAIDPGQGLVIDQLGHFSQPQEYKWVKGINFDIEHRTPQFGEFSTDAKIRRAEFKAKRKDWKQDPERFAKRKERWKNLTSKYLKKANKFKEFRKRFKKKKYEFKEQRRNYFKKRKKLFNEMQNIKEKLRNTKRSDRSKRRSLKEKAKNLKNKYKSLKKERSNYINRVKNNLPKLSPKNNVIKPPTDFKNNRSKIRRRRFRKKLVHHSMEVITLQVVIINQPLVINFLNIF